MGTEVFDILANALELFRDPDLVIRDRFDPFLLPFFRNLSHNRIIASFKNYKFLLNPKAKSISQICVQKIF